MCLSPLPSKDALPLCAALLPVHQFTRIPTCLTRGDRAVRLLLAPSQLHWPIHLFSHQPPPPRRASAKEPGYLAKAERIAVIKPQPLWTNDISFYLWPTTTTRPPPSTQVTHAALFSPLPTIHARTGSIQATESHTCGSSRCALHSCSSWPRLSLGCRRAMRSIRARALALSPS